MVISLTPLNTNFNKRPQTSPHPHGHSSLLSPAAQYVASAPRYHPHASAVTPSDVNMKQIFLKNTDMKYWKDSFLVEECNYRSFATLAEARLLEAEMKTCGLDVPNEFRTAVACDILNKMSDIFVR